MFSLSRNSTGKLANLWWTVDKGLLFLVGAIVVIGIFLNFSASPAIANKIGVESYHFIKRQIFFLFLAGGVMLLLSMQSLKTIRRTAIIGYVIAIALTIMTLFWGEETKGASRWIRILGFSLQQTA